MFSNRDSEGVDMEADPFENMREQMERERDQFFKAAPRDWPSDNISRGGMFSLPRTSLGGFPGGGSATLRPRFSRDPDFDEDFGLSGTRSLPRSQRNRDRETEDDLCSDRSSGSGGSGDHPDSSSIPIRVFHERPKQRYGDRERAAQRSTTELPAKASPGPAAGLAATSGSESPRLERAASEPPHKFKQRLNISANPGYSTIPENGSDHTQQSSQGSGGRHQPHLASERSNPIKTSASAPSVPTSDLGAPVAPPRRSPPRSLGAMSGSGGPQPPPTVGSSVRHIPIFVEGRPEPIFNQNLSTQQQPQAGGQSQDLPFSKPSEFYPPGVQRIRSREEAAPQGVQEPTTPLGPPPGPIPMGYVPPAQDLLKPEPQPPAEPTTPLGPPPGPIPMGYVPREDGQPCPQEDQEDSGPPVPPQRHRSPPQPQPASIQPQEPSASRKSSSEKPADVGSRKSSDSDGRKDPVVNVIPIRVEPGRSESPRPKQSSSSSRHPSQEPSKSPVNVRKPENPQQPNPPPLPQPSQAPTNPKIMKLAKIQEDVESLTNEIKNFNGSKDTKEYRFLEEMLTRQLLALDGIEPDGDTEIRTIRKESINSVNRCLSLLDRKVSDVTTDAAANDQILSELAEKSLGDKKNDNQGSS